MKKVMIIGVMVIMFLAGYVVPAIAGDFVLLEGRTTTGAGTAVPINEYIENWTCQVTITGGPSAVTVRIEGNLGGTLYDPTGMAVQTLSAGQLAAGIATFLIPNGYMANLRAYVVTLTGGTDPTVSATCGGVPR